MTKKHIAITMALVMGASLMAGCGASTGNSVESTTAAVSQQTEEDVIYGQVSSVSDDSITIEVGTQKEMPDQEQAEASADEEAAGQANEHSQPEDSSETESSEKSEDQNADQAQADSKNNSAGAGQQPGGNGQQPSMLDLTGEEKSITITDETTVEKSSMGQPGGGPGQGENGQPPQMPGNQTASGQTSDGQVSDDQTETGQPPEMPNGQAPSGEAPSGQTENSQPPELPDSQAPSDQTSSAENSDDSQSGDQTADSGNQEESNVNTDASNSSKGSDNQNQQSDQSQAGSDNQNQQSVPGGQGQPQMQTEEIEVSEIEEGDTVAITLDESGNAEKITVMSMSQGCPGNGGQGGNGGPGGQQSAPESYEAVNTYSEDTGVTGEEISSTGTDENAIHVTDGAKVTVSDSKISRNSEDSQGGDNSSFYGTGAAVLTTNGTTIVKDSQIETDANGGAGIFSYGDGVTYVSGVTINTEKGTSGGIHVAGGGTLYAWDSTVETNGESSAAIRSDRGGGTMVVDGGSYTSNGTGSPAIYSTADIAVNDADLTATGSEAICIEGNNSIHLFNSELTGNMSDSEQNDTTWNVILYQSMSGDSEEGNSTFEMDGGTLTAKNGGMFYTTNTESTITLKNVDITNAEDAEFFLRCTGNQNQRGWGTSGENGADCLFTAISQTMEGDVIWDSISQLDFYMTQNSSLTGAVVNDESYAGNGGDGYCNLTIEEGSTWIVTGDSTLTALSNSGSIVDAEGKTVTIKGTDGTVYVEGDSDYSVTVSQYNDSADTSGASEISSWSQYEVEEV